MDLFGGIRDNAKRTRRSGFTMLEMTIVVTLIAIIGSVLVRGAFSFRGQKDMEGTMVRISSLLREMQAKSMAQASSSAWGVHFGNPVGGQPFFASFYGSYTTSTRSGFYTLPSTLAYATSTVPIGGSVDVTFNYFSGTTAASTTVNIYIKNKPQSSSTIVVSPSGAVSY